MRRGEREVRLPLAVGLALCVVSVLLSTPSGLLQSAPAVDSASVDGSSLTLTFSESLTSGSTAVASEFAVKLGEESIVVASAAISGSDVTLTLMEAVPDVDCTDQSVKVSFTPSSSSLTGTSGGTVDAFSDQAVTNVTDAAPEIVSLETDLIGRYIYVTFCERISAGLNGFLTINAFTLLLNGTAEPINDVQIRSDTPTRLRIIVSDRDAIGEGDTITVAYDRDDANDGDPPQDENQGYTLVKSWAARSVTNNVDRPPTLQSVSAHYDIVTLTFNEALDEDSVPDASAFTIAGVQHAPTVSGVSISGNTVTLTTSSILHHQNSLKYTIRYLEPNQSPLRQLDGVHNVEDFLSETFDSTTPTARPKVEAAVVDGSTLTITFDLPLKAVAPASAFTVAGEDGITVSASSFSGSVVTLTLSPAVSVGSTITVSYVKPDGPPRIEGRNTRDAEAFSGQSVTNNTAAPAPEFSEASVSADGTELTIIFSLVLDSTSDGLPDKSTFSLSGTSASVESVRVDGSTVVLGLSPLADVNETITVSYTPPSDAMDSRLQSSEHGKAVEAFSNESATNLADGNPRPLSATVDGDQVVIEFDRALDDQSIPAVSSFAIGGVAATVSDVTISGQQLTLTISPAVTHLDTITIDYASPTETPLKRAGSALLVDSFSGQTVTNNTGDPTPRFVSASMDATGRRLTIVMSHPLLVTSAGTPATTTFTLSGSTSAEVESVAVEASSVILTLMPAADLNETVSVSYAPPTDAAASALQSPDGVWQTPVWSNEMATNNADGVPRLVDGTANADTVTLMFDRALDESSVPATTDFSITPAGKTVSDVDVDGTLVTLTLSDSLAHDDEVTVSYSAAGSVKLKRDGSALAVAAFSAVKVTNETPEPLLRSVVGDRNSIVLTFTKALDTSGMPGATAFSLGADQPAVSGVMVASLTVTLTLDRPLQEGAAYTLSYTVPSMSALATTDGSQVPAFSEPLTNNTDVAPMALSASGVGSTITIEFDQSLDAGSTVAASLFSISADTERSVTAVVIVDDSLELTLSRPLAEDEVASIEYAEPMQAGIADSGGNRTDSFMLTIDNQTDTAPVPVSGVIEDDTITIVLDQELYADPRFELPIGYPARHFPLSGTDAAIVFVYVSNNRDGVGQIEITLSRVIAEGEAVTIRYIPFDTSLRIRDDDAGENRAQINNYPLQNLNDVAPVVESATVDGIELVITFDQELDADSLPDVTAFSLSNDGPAVASVSIEAEELTLTLASTAIEDAEYTIAYTAPESGGLQDPTGNGVVDFSQMVENTTDYAPFPMSVSTDIEGKHLLITFDQRLDPQLEPDADWFMVIAATEEIPVARVDDPNDAVLTVFMEEDAPIREGAEVNLSYRKPASGGLRDDDAGNEVESFSERIENLVNVAPLVATDAEGNEKIGIVGNVVTIEFDQDLDPAYVPPANCEELEAEGHVDFCELNPGVQWFRVQLNGGMEIPIESVEVSGRLVILTLARRVSPADKVTVRYQTYSLPEEKNLRDTSTPPKETKSFDAKDARNTTAAAAIGVEFDRNEPDRLLIRFDGELSNVSTVDSSSLSVGADGSEIGILSLNASGTELSLRLARGIPECASVVLAYEPGEPPLLDSDGRRVAAFRFDVANLIDSDWGLRCVHSNAGGVVLTFDESGVPNEPGFEWSLSVNGEAREIEVESAGSVTRLLPSESVCEGDSVEIRYSSGDEANALVLHRAISDAAPCVVSAVTDGVTLRVTFDGPLDSVLPGRLDFEVTGDVGVEAVEDIAGDVLTLRLASPGVPAGQAVLLTYSGSSLRGGGLTVGPFAVEISDHTAPPELVSAYAVDDSIFLSFDQPLIARQVPASRFIPTGPGIDQSVELVSVGGSSVYLKLNSSLPDEPDLFGLVYVAGARGGLAGLTGSRVTDSVFLVRNYTETRPSVLSASVNGLQLDVTFDQRIEANGALPSDFSVLAGRRMIAVESLEWTAFGVTITLAERVTSLDAVSLTYSPGDGREVQDASRLALAEFVFWVENETPAPTTVEGKVDDARLRASSGGTTLERELVRAFASQDGMRVTVAAGDGWTTAVRGSLQAMVDTSRVDAGPVRIYVAPIDDPSVMLEHFPFVPAACWHGEADARFAAWWVGESDVRGVPTDHGVGVRLVGAFDAFHAVSVCVVDLINGEWQPYSTHRPIVGPAMLLIRETPYWFNWNRWPLAG